MIASDPATGAVYASRGGPGSGPGGAPGIGPARFVAVSQPYAPGFPDYSEVNAVQTVGYIQAPFSDVTAYMDAVAVTTNANNLTYLGPIQNSNSYAFSLIGGMGFQRPTPAEPAMGYNTNRGSPALQCTTP